MIRGASLSPDRRWPDYGTVWRWHFYAGLLCIPFVLWLAATGSIYLFKPQIDSWLDRPYDNLPVHGPPAAPSAQIEAALRAVRGSVLHAYQLPHAPRAAVQILVGRDAQLLRVYVHPETTQVLKIVNEDDRFTNLIFHLHGELMQGDRGSMLVETAASWTLIMLITGLYLWWPSGSGVAGVLYPRIRRRGRLLWRDLHAVAGFWVTFFAMFLLVTGLPWAKSWGGMLKEVRQWTSAQPVHQDWTTGRSSELAQRRLEASPPAVFDEHAAHHHAASSGSGHLAEVPPLAPHAYRVIDGLIAPVQAEHLDPPVLISPPSAVSGHWSARSDTQNRPRRAELVLDPLNLTVLSRSNFSQRPLFDRIVDTGVAAHEGQLFGPFNQALGLFTAVSLWLVCISAIIMWWQRRPAGLLGAPPAGSRPRLARTLFGLIVLLGVVLPLLGASLLIVLVLERSVLRRWSTARRFLGLPKPYALSTE